MPKKPDPARKKPLSGAELKQTVTAVQERAAKILAEVEKTHADADRAHRAAEESHRRAQAIHKEVRDSRRRRSG